MEDQKSERNFHLNQAFVGSRVSTNSGKTSDGELVPADIRVWAAGIRGADILEGIGGLETTRSNQLGMESVDARARAVASVRAGYHATGGKTVFISVRIQRLKLDAGAHWGESDYTIRLTARSERATLEGSEVRSYVESAKGEFAFRTGAAGTGDWITFVEREDEVEGFERFRRFGPQLGFTAQELAVRGPEDEFDLTLSVRNSTNGQVIKMPGPRVRIPERIWALNPPMPGTLGLLGMLNPAQEGGLFDVVGRGWKYRKCTLEVPKVH